MTASWPEAYRDWEGMIDDLAAMVDHLLPGFGLPGDSSPNARLLRHYVTVGVVSRPERRGKEAFFGFRHLVEALVARALLLDGWPLAKIADLAATTDTEALLSMGRTRPGPAHSPARRRPDVPPSVRRAAGRTPHPLFRGERLSRVRVPERRSSQGSGGSGAPSIHPSRRT